MKRLLLDSSSSVFQFFQTRVAQNDDVQQALGLRLNYPLRLSVNAERAFQVRTCLTPDIASQLTTLDVVDAKGVDLITDFGVYRYRFEDGAPLTLDEIAEGSAEHLRCLNGVCRTRCTVRRVYVSGLDARWISFSGERWDERIGVEELGMFDPGTGTLWTVHATYKQRPSMHVLPKWALYRARASAKRILASICYVPPR